MNVIVPGSRAKPSPFAALQRKLQSMWYPVTEPWQFRVLDALPPSIDVAQLQAALAQTPTQRVEAAMRLNELAREIQNAARASQMRLSSQNPIARVDQE